MGLTFTLATMVCNELAETRDAMLGVFVRTTGRFDYTLLDNGSTNMVLDFMRRTLTPRPEVQDAVNFSFIRNAENAGSVVGMQQIYEATETDLLAVLHNDVWMHEDGWNERVIRMFEADPLLGLVSFFGCPGISATGRRRGLQAGSEIGWSNMTDAEKHGMRTKEPHAIAVPDGFAMIFRMEMLRKADGFDTRYRFHHAYDRAAGLQSLALGYRNMVAPILCSHGGVYGGSVTARGTSYQAWLQAHNTNDAELYWENEERLARIWGPCLPLQVEPDFTFSRLEPFTGAKTGRNIVGYDWKAAAAA